MVSREYKVILVKQNGFALLMLLSIVFSAGTFGLLLMSDQGLIKRVNTHASITRADQTLLIDARQSLLSYTALYPWLYGPQGAGPGHLPCPDTDITQNSDQSLDQWSSSDGPNPPCGRSSTAVGNLPRHIRLSDQRYAFHFEPSQRAHYRVSDRVINNPVNRVVNPGLDASSINLQAAAIIELPALSGSLRHSRAEVEISIRSLIEASLPAVAVWIIDKSRNLSHSWCQSQDVDKQRLIQPAASERFDALQCSRFIELIKRCPESQALFLALDQLPDIDLPEIDLCSINALDALRIDGVPVKRHWFPRNQWSDWVGFSYDENCVVMATPVEPCELVINRLDRQFNQPIIQDAAGGNLNIELRWRARDGH